MTSREWILSRFRLASALKNGGVTQRAIYGGVHSFALATLDEELATMRREGLLGHAQGLWFLRGGASTSNVPRARRLKGPVDRRADLKQRSFFDDDA